MFTCLKGLNFISYLKLCNCQKIITIRKEYLKIYNCMMIIYIENSYLKQSLLNNTDLR